MGGRREGAFLLFHFVMIFFFSPCVGREGTGVFCWIYVRSIVLQSQFSG